MIFYSDKFYFDDVYSLDFNIYLVYESKELLNKYGISYNKEDENEITLTFCYATENGCPLKWDEETLEDVLGWLITDNYKEFISEDDEDIVFFLKGESYEKRFTHDKKGLIDVTFKILSPCGYRKQTAKILSNGNPVNIYNPSNIKENYKPVIELSNVSSSTVVISNTSLDKEPFEINNLSGKNIFIDNMLGTIVDEDGKNLIMDSNRKWIELKKGDNYITVEGDSEVTFKSYYPVMV